jgi:hypothetical protein
MSFERESDARRFLDAMRERLGKFELSLHPDKTRLIEFGRFAATDANGVGSENRNLRVLGLYLRLRAISPRNLLAQREDPSGPHAGQAGGH